VNSGARFASQTNSGFRPCKIPDTLRSARLLTRIFFLLALAASLAGCKRPPGRLSAAEIHIITSELAAAAGKAAPADSDIRKQFVASDEAPERTDRLDITLYLADQPSSERAAVARLLQSLAVVATRHGLTQDAPAESREGVLFNYRHAGLATQTIHIHSGLSTAIHGSVPSSQTGSAKLAIILDDLGNDRAAAEAIFALPYPLTISVLPNHPHSVEIAEEAHRRGYQVLLHLPMQAVGNEKPEAPELRPGMSESDVTLLVNQMLQAVPHVVGVNNHQGSQATSDPALMSELMPVLRDRQLFYIDSRTAATTVAFETAREDGVRSAFRNVPFLDDVAEVAAVRKQLEMALRGARGKGEAVAIGHPHPATLQALSEILPHAEGQGVHLVFASDLVH
jgi:polysaccharide deacetylase 2 family uncharacterized protein YibQ